MEVTCSSETSRYIPEDRTLHNDSCENLMSYKAVFGFMNAYEEMLRLSRTWEQ
jgi:hypothetical protein